MGFEPPLSTLSYDTSFLQSRIFSPSPPEAHPDHDFTEVEHTRGGEAVVGSAGPLSSAEATLEAVGNGKARIVKAEMLFR